MKGRSFTVPFFAAISLLFLFSPAHSQNIGTLAAPSVTLETGSKQALQPNSEIIHVVRQGDSLIRISRIYDTTPKALRSANGLTGSKILIGQKLSIPVSQSTADELKTSKTKGASALSYNTHTVRRGENLIKISGIYDTTPQVLKSANELKSSIILIGQKLKIPIPKSAAAAEEASKTKIPAALSSYTPSSISHVLLKRDLNENLGEIVPPRRIRLVEAGFKLLGTKYRFGGFSEKYGFDCSGLVKNLFSKFTIDLPHSSREQFRQGERVDRDNLEKGDLVFFSSGGKHPNHVGIYIGDDQFLHAARKAEKVIISDLNKLWYAVRYLGARRITDLWWEGQGLTAATNN